MKTGILLAIMAAGGMAFAQSSNTNLDSEVASTALQTQTSTETLPAAATTSTKKWGANLYIQAATDVRDQQLNKSNAVIAADNYFGVNYKLSDMWTVEVGYNFSVVNTTSGPSSNVDPSSYHSNYEGRSPEIILKQTLGKIGNSDPVSVMYYYYAPMGLYTQTAGGNGILRLDATTNYNVKKWTFSPFLSNRTYLDNRSNATPDSIYRFNLGVINAYNFSDAFNAYYFPYTDARSTQLNYGRLQFDKKNWLCHEMGVNYTKKIASTSVTVNPAFVNYQHLDNGQGLGYTYYADNGKETNTSEIDLNIFASF